MERPGARVAGEHAVPLYGPRPSSLVSGVEQPQPDDYAAPDASTGSAAPKPQADPRAVAPGPERLVVAPVQPAAPVTSAERIEALHARTGLTWQQLARLFGVSRRAVHMWASGNRMSSTNLERLDRVEAAVEAVGELDPELARQALMSRRGGASIYAQLLREVAELQPRADARAWVDRSSVDEP